jgi:hypothetical protein
MKQSRGAIPAAETGAPSGTYKGSRNFDKLAEKGGRNATTNESMRGSGMAPKPSGGASLYGGNDSPSHPPMSGLARVKNRPSAPTGKLTTAGSFTPVQNNAQANLTGQATGQAEVLPRGSSSQISPQTRMPKTGNPVATGKPKRKGLGSAFFGDN